MSKCEFCPIKCGQCIAEKTNHKAYCDRANPHHPEHTPKYIELLQHLSCGTPYTKGEVLQLEKIPRDEIKQEYPSLLQQGKNLFSSVSNFIKSGLELSEEEEYNFRVATCQSCPSFDKDAGRCRECGCFIKTKARIRSDRCPLGKWEKPQHPIEDVQASPRNEFVNVEIVNGCDGCRNQ